MALMHKTTMSPSKLELLAAWLPAQPWFAGDVAALENIGGYRLDDPAGEVGLEGILLTAGDATVYHVPLTYRGAPVDVDEAAQLGTSEHGVLGTRWVTDGAADPVFRAVLAATIASGGHGALEFVQDAEGNETQRDPRVRVFGSGHEGGSAPDFADATFEEVQGLTRVSSDEYVLDLVRIVDPARTKAEDQLALTGAWEGQPEATILALFYGG